MLTIDLLQVLAEEAATVAAAEAMQSSEEEPKNGEQIEGGG